MWITDALNRMFRPSTSVLIDPQTRGIFGTWFDERRDFSTAIWYNICDLLLDLAEDTEVSLADEQKSDRDKFYKFSAFSAFFYNWGKVILQRLYDEGFVVIGWDGIKFWQMDAKEYATPSDKDKTIVRPYRAGVEAYVMKSACWMSRGCSDRSLCRPWLEFVDDVCNGSATISKRLGAVIVASPKTYSGAPTPNILTDEQKKALEKEVQEHYGTNSKQSQLMVLPKEMNFQTISLASLDIKFAEKLRECILAICDRVKVPANQVAIIDANSSKALSNGSELREGDKAKYKSFKRLFERTFVQMANDMDLKIVYKVAGEPIDAEVNAPTA